MSLDPRSDGPRIPRCDRGRTADHDPRPGGEGPQHRIADPPGRVVEIDIDATATGVRQCGLEVLRLVVDRGVVAEGVNAQPGLGFAASNADVRQPAILAICPTAEPTAPAAVETTTVSPARGRPTSSRPK